MNILKEWLDLSCVIIVAVLLVLAVLFVVFVGALLLKEFLVTMTVQMIFGAILMTAVVRGIFVIGKHME